MSKFLQSKTPLVICSLVCVILSVTFLLLLIYHAVALSYPQLSNQAMQLQQAMFNLKMDIGQTNVQKRYAGLPEDFTGVNCESNDKIKKDCDAIKNITKEDVRIFTSKNNFCFSIKYEPGFYNKNDKLACRSFGDTLHGICDEKSVSCIEVSRAKKNLDIKTIILLISLAVSVILSIIFIVRLLFVSKGAGVLLVLLVFAVLIVLYFLFLGPPVRF